VAASEPVEVQLARIAKEQAIEVARIQARQDRNWNETRVEVAEIDAEASTAAAVAEAQIVGAALEASDPPEPPPEPIEIVAPPVDDDQGDDEELPPAEGSPVPTQHRKRVGLGAW
jgi:hypothetical protein